MEKLLKSVEQEHWLLMWAIILILIGLLIFYKNRNHLSKKDKQLDPAISDLEDVFNPITWIVASISKNVPAWLIGLLPIILGLYIIYDNFY